MSQMPQSFPPVEPDQLAPRSENHPQTPRPSSWAFARQVWWSFFWRMFVYTNVATILIEIVASQSGAPLLYDPIPLKTIAELLVFVVASLVAFKQALDVHSLHE